MYKILSLDAVDTDLWLEYLCENPNSLFFHSPAFYESLNETKDYKGFVYFVSDNEDKIRGLILGYVHTVKHGILSRISRRIVIPQIPLYDDIEVLDFILSEYNKTTGKKAIYTEFRNHSPDPVFHELAIKHNLIFKPHLNSIVDCTEHDSTWSNISSSRRRQIRRALKNGAKIIENPDEAQIKEFYTILSDLYKNKVKKPLIELKYFMELYERSYDEKYHTKFLLVEYEYKVIGGIVAPISKDSFIHEHYIAGLDQEYRDQYPSVVATWAAIEYAINNKIEAFDFMGAGKPDEEYGVRDFKLRFGGDLLEPGRYEFVPYKLPYFIATKGFELLSKLKRKE